jgi:hypothetical protein
MTDDSNRGERALRRFFDERLMPVADRLRSGGVSLLETGIDAGAASYYRQRPTRRMTAADFRWGGAVDEYQIAADLHRMWSSGGQPQLADLAPEVARLAVALRRPEEQAAEVADFIYVMY